MLHLVVVKIIPTLFWNFNTKFFSFCIVALTSAHSWLMELQERKDKISTYTCHGKTEKIVNGHKCSRQQT